MPGGRLTQQDRGQIAEGLAAGLGYAEIARRLARPTSTISREVARNDGPGGYRADKASQATGQRARRRKVTAPRPASETTDAYGRDPGAVRDFEDEFTKVVIQTGLPKMAARVLACLYVTDSGSRTAAELVERLRVSPASISKAIGYLEALEMVRRTPDIRRRERYVIGDDVWFRAWSTSARTNAMWGDIARHGAEVFGATTPTGVRMAEMRQFFERLYRDMTGGGGEAIAAAGDARTALAALVHAAKPLTVDALAAALDWEPDRVINALSAAEEHPGIVDPVALQQIEGGAYTVIAKLDRLTATQREALSKTRRPTRR